VPTANVVSGHAGATVVEVEVVDVVDEVVVVDVEVVLDVDVEAGVVVEVVDPVVVPVTPTHENRR
jgi:hypothetical protein